MKVEQSVRAAYQRQLPLNRLIKTEVEIIARQFDKRWYYIDRIKSEESFAQKLETGQVEKSLDMEDFFACTLVVQNSSELARATGFIEENFELKYRKPESDTVTKSSPSDFQFDDLRMYVRLKQPLQGPREIDKITFEIQIKTFLKYAWGIATHDLTYKTDAVKWSRLRLAHQIRAMLEHAELSIEQFKELSDSQSINRVHDEYAEIGEIIELLQGRWEIQSLPRDMQRLARTLREVFSKLDLNTKTAFEYLDKETADGRGIQELNLSPYSVMMQSILAHHSINAQNAKRRRPNRKIMLSSAVSLPTNFTQPISDLFHIF